jgi:hypothetical protein
MHRAQSQKEGGCLGCRPNERGWFGGAEAKRNFRCGAGIHATGDDRVRGIDDDGIASLAESGRYCECEIGGCAETIGAGQDADRYTAGGADPACRGSHDSRCSSATDHHPAMLSDASPDEQRVVDGFFGCVVAGADDGDARLTHSWRLSALRRAGETEAEG